MFHIQNNILVFIAILYCNYYTISAGKMGVSDIKACPGHKYPWLIESTDIMHDGTQEFSWNVTVDELAVGNDNYASVNIERIVGGHKFPLTTIKETGICGALYKFGGDMYLDITKVLKIKHPKQCPLDKGHYKMVGYVINYKNIPLAKIVPKGNYFVTFLVTNLAKTRTLACMSAGFTKE